MSDLAQALISLGAAARGRRTARSKMQESAAVTARAIVKQLRSGDAVSVVDLSKGKPVQINTSMLRVEYSVEKLTWRIESTPQNSLHPKGASVLCRAGVSLHDEREPLTEREMPGFLYPVTSPTYIEADTKSAVSLPRAEDLEAFSREAPEVIAAFTDLLDENEHKFDEAASKLASLKPSGGNAYSIDRWITNLCRVLKATFGASFKSEKTVDGALLHGASRSVAVNEIEAHRVEIVMMPEGHLLFGPEPIDKFAKRIHDAAAIIAATIASDARIVEV